MSDDPRYPYLGDPALAGPVAEALSRVEDPEMALDIVDLGLVYGVALAGGVADVRLTMTSAACPVTEVIVEDATRELARTLGDGWTVRVELVWDPPWTPERLSLRARRVMGWE